MKIAFIVINNCKNLFWSIRNLRTFYEKKNVPIS